MQMFVMCIFHNYFSLRFPQPPHTQIFSEDSWSNTNIFPLNYKYKYITLSYKKNSLYWRWPTVKSSKEKLNFYTWKDPNIIVFSNIKKMCYLFTFYEHVVVNATYFNVNVYSHWRYDFDLYLLYVYVCVFSYVYV